MNPHAVPPLIRPPSRHWWLWAALIMVLLPLIALGVLGVGVASCLHLSSGTRALRSELARASGAEWRKQIGVNLGSVTLGAVRTGLSFASLDPEARAALRAVRGVELGIYELASGNRPDGVAMLAVADDVLAARGWERVVGVLDGEQMVGLYLLAKPTSGDRMQCYIVVLDGRQLVVVNARADLDPLVDCLQRQIHSRTDRRSLASR